MLVWEVAYTEAERKDHNKKVKREREREREREYIYIYSKDCHNLICINKR